MLQSSPDCDIVVASFGCRTNPARFCADRLGDPSNEVQSVMRGRSLIGRACLSQRSSRAAMRARYIAILVWCALLCWPAPGGAEPPSTIGVELNRLEDQGGNCRAYLVIANPGSAEYSGFALDLVVFDRGGTIMRRLAVDVAPVRPAKTSVKVFDISETACGT